MTIEPSAIRFHFGTSVRTWNADDKPPQPIIAKVFRDVGESDEGLTPAVEQCVGSLMRRMFRKRPEPTEPPKPREVREYVKVQERKARLLAALANGPMTRKQARLTIGCGDGEYATKLFRGLEAEGFMSIARVKNNVVYTITPAGRTHLIGDGREWL